MKASETTNQIALEHIEPWTGRLAPNDATFDAEGISFQSGDVLFGKLRPYLAKVHVAVDAGQAVGDFIVLRPHTGILEPRFLGYFLRTPAMIDSLTAAAYGSKMPRTSWEELSHHEVLLPPISEQRRIAAFLDYETARIEELIEEQERLAGLLLEKLRAIYASAVTTGLSDAVEYGDSGVQWLGSVPAHWTVAPIRTFAKLESGHTPSRGRPDFWIDCDIPWVSLNDSKQLAAVDYISDTAVHINSAGLAGSSARLLPARSVVFTRDATIGLAAITTRPMAVSQHIIAWVCDERKTLPEFLLIVLYAMKQELERHTFGATIRTIGMPDIRKLVAAFPPLDEQRDIARVVFAQKLQLEQSVSEVRRLQALLVERRSALITAAVTGQIDVSSWRPPDDWLVPEPV